VSYGVCYIGPILVTYCYWLVFMHEDLFHLVTLNGLYALPIILVLEVIFGGIRMLFHKCRGLLGRHHFFRSIQIIAGFVLLSSSQLWLLSFFILAAALFFANYCQVLHLHVYI